MINQSGKARRGSAGQGRVSLPAFGLVFGLHVVIGSVLLPRMQHIAARWIRKDVAIAPRAERLTFVETPPAPTPRVPTRVARPRPAQSRASTAPAPVAPSATTIENETTNEAIEAVSKPAESAATLGVRPRLSDPRLWAPTTTRLLPASPATPLPTMNAALSRTVDSTKRAGGMPLNAVSDWTKTDAKGRKWGLDPGGLRLGRIGISIQPPALTDRERARMASREDIDRMSRTTAGDAAFDRLKAELRQRRENARRDTM